MSNISAKKQNRILLIALVVILASTAVLIAVTGSANKKKSEKNPPLGTETTESITEKESQSSVKISENNSSDDKSSEKTPESEVIEQTVGENKKKETKEEDKKEAEVSAMENDILPEFAAPVNAPVLKDYSDDVPVFSYTMNDYRVHNGLDFAASIGTPVCAAADGTVCEITDDPMMGVCVGISHSGGAVTRYKGLSNETMDLCKVGDSVTRGQVIGSAGDTALIESAEENHVHFELTVNGESQNPADYFPVSYISNIVED